jgi:hypothetical protein
MIVVLMEFSRRPGAEDGVGHRGLGGTWAPHCRYVDICHRGTARCVTALEGNRQAADVDQAIAQSRPVRCAILHEAHSGAAVKKKLRVANSATPAKDT